MLGKRSNQAKLCVHRSGNYDPRPRASRKTRDAAAQKPGSASGKRLAWHFRRRSKPRLGHFQGRRWRLLSALRFLRLRPEARHCAVLAPAPSDTWSVK